MSLISLASLIPIAFIGLIVLGAMALSGGRGSPDPEGSRPYALYLFTVCFVFGFTLLFSGYGLIGAILRASLARTRPVGFLVFGGNLGLRTQYIRESVSYGVVSLAVGLVLWFHVRRAVELARTTGFSEGPARRVLIVYCYATCLAALMISVVGVVGAIDALLKIAMPGTFGDSAGGFSGLTSRSEGVAQFVSVGALALAAVWTFRYHWRRGEKARRPVSQMSEAPPAAPETPTG